MADKQEDKSILTKVKEAIIGTPEQNKKAAEEMKAQGEAVEKGPLGFLGLK